MFKTWGASLPELTYPLNLLSSWQLCRHCCYGDAGLAAFANELVVVCVPTCLPLPSVPSALTVYKAYPYMARSLSEQLFTSRCCKLCCEHLCQHHHQSCVSNINTFVCVSTQHVGRAPVILTKRPPWLRFSGTLQ